MERGLCYFHANPDKARSWGATGAGGVSTPTSSQRKILHRLNRLPSVASTVAYVATVLLLAYEADAATNADTPALPYVPLIYRSLICRDRRKPEADDVIDLETSRNSAAT